MSFKEIFAFVVWKGGFLYRRGLTFYSFNSFHLFKAMILKIDFFFQEKKKDINLSGSWQDGVEILIAMGNKKKVISFAINWYDIKKWRHIGSNDFSSW